MKLINLRTTCNKCSRPSKEVFCDSCFVKVFEKRIRKHMAELDIGSYQIIIVTDKFCEYLVKKIIKAPLKIINQGKITKKITKKQLSDKKIVILDSATADDAIHGLLQYYFTGEKKKQPTNNMHILGLVTVEEAEKYAKIKKLFFKKKKGDDIYSFVSKLEQQFPGTKHALYSTIKELNRAKVL